MAVVGLLVRQRMAVSGKISGAAGCGTEIQAERGFWAQGEAIVDSELRRS
jgi:hypothetical protein